MATTTTRRRPIKATGKTRIPLGSTLAIGSLFCAAHAAAADWRVTPTLGVRGVYTDNVRLAPQGAEQSDFIFEVSPGLSIVANGPGLKVKANYALQHLRYANDGKDSGNFHKLNATANAELIKNFLFLDGNASVSQQSLSLVGPQPTDNYSITDNRTSLKTISVSPYLRHDFRGIGTAELRYTHTTVDTSSSAFSTSRFDRFAAGVDSDPSFRTLGWGFNYQFQRRRMPGASRVDSATTSAKLRYMVSPQFYLTGSAGYDDYDYTADIGAPAPAGTFYTAGFSWRPTERTSVDLSTGERFYGRTYSLDARVRSRASIWNVSYDEAITTYPQESSFSLTDRFSDFLNQLLRTSIPDEVQRQQAVDRLILGAGLQSQSLNYLTNQFFLQKTWRASVAITGAKNTVLLSIFRVRRDDQSAQSTVLSFPAGSIPTTGDTRQSGVSALWNWKMTARTSATLSTDMTRSTVNASGTEIRVKKYTAALVRRIQPKLDGVLELKHVDQDSGIASSNYQENAVSAFLSMKF